MSLIPLVLTLSIISSRDQLGYILPISGVEVGGLDAALDAVCLDSPVEQLSLILIPVTLSRILTIKISFQGEKVFYRLEFYAINR